MTSQGTLTDNEIKLRLLLCTILGYLIRFLIFLSLFDLASKDSVAGMYRLEQNSNEYRMKRQMDKGSEQRTSATYRNWDFCSVSSLWTLFLFFHFVKLLFHFKDNNINKNKRLLFVVRIIEISMIDYVTIGTS